MNAAVSTNKSVSSKKPTKPRKAAPTTAPAPEVVQSPTEPLTDAQRAEMLASLSPQEQFLMHQATMKLERGDDPQTVKAWFDATQAKPAAPYEPPAHLLMSIVMPMAISLLQNVINPVDVFEQRVNFTDMLDFMVDGLVDNFHAVDDVALVQYINTHTTGGRWVFEATPAS